MSNEITEELLVWYNRAKKHARTCWPNKLQLASWWLRKHYDIPTSKVNNFLDKLVKLGFLTKETKPGSWSIYSFTEKTPNETSHPTLP